MSDDSPAARSQSHAEERHQLQRAAFARDATEADKARLSSFEARLELSAIPERSPADKSPSAAQSGDERMRAWTARHPAALLIAGGIVVASLGIAIGLAAPQLSNAFSGSSDYPENERGLTYGPLPSDGSAPPDLFEINSTADEAGYVYYIQVYGKPLPAGQDAPEQTRSTAEIPVYLSDGFSRIGEAVVELEPRERG